MPKPIFKVCYEQFKNDYPDLTIVSAAEYKGGYLISAKDGPDGVPFLYRVKDTDTFATPFSPLSDMRVVNEAFAKYRIDIKRLT